MGVLRVLAFPFSLIYAAVVYIRNFLYDIGFFRQEKFSTPIVCIGNLSTGGTGKTPMTSFLVEILQDRFKVAVLSRGYRRKTKGFILADDNSKVEDLGDEPFQLKRKHTALNVAVDADRCNGIKVLQQQINPDVIILDDAFQHRKVRPHTSILLTAYDSLYVDDWYLPTGNLRDAKNQSKRADIIVVTKCPRLPSEKERGAILQKLHPEEHQKVIFGALAYTDSVFNDETKITLNSIENKKIALVTGIANAKPLVNHLKNKGLEFQHLEFNDHHYFTKKEIDSFKAYDKVLTTEKDYVRLDNRLKNAYYIGVGHVFSESDDKLLEEEIIKTIKLRSVPGI